jgi:hypothetical protein
MGKDKLPTTWKEKKKYLVTDELYQIRWHLVDLISKVDHAICYIDYHKLDIKIKKDKKGG